jgi:hypothetical protein
VEECKPLSGGGGGKGTQPWRLTVTSAAALLMDFHAHLCRDEIIGFLGGYLRN